MSDERLRGLLEKAFPDTPAVFHERMAQIAENEAARKKRVAGRVFGALRIALVCVVILFGCTGALALMNHFGVLDIYSILGMPPYYPLPEAEDLVQKDLADVQIGSLEWQVDEAVFDGRILRILFSVRDVNGTPVQTPAPEKLLRGGSAGEIMFRDLCQREQMNLKLIGNGEVLVDGRPCFIQYMEFLPGDDPCVVVGWVDCRMEGLDDDAGEIRRYLPEGYMVVEMPFGYDREKNETDPDSLAFVLKAGDAASRYAVPLPAPCTLDSGAVFAFEDLHFSPVQVYMDYTVTVPPERTGDLPEDEFLLMDAAESRPEFQARPRLMNARDEVLGERREMHYGVHVGDDGSLVLSVHVEFTPSDRYTDTVYLVSDTWKVPIPLKQ